MHLNNALALTLICCLISSVVPVDRSKFRTCAQSAFCTRARKVEPNASPYQLDLSTLTTSTTSLEVILVNMKNNVKFRLELGGLEDSTFRFKLREAFPLKERFEVPHVVENDLNGADITVKDQTDAGFTVECGENKALVRANPFAIDFYSNGVHVMSTNARGLLKFEHTRQKPSGEAVEDNQENGDAAPKSGDEEENEPGMWEESFGGNTDSKPNGPQAVALDFTFLDTDNVYGVPEHADTLSLKDTSGGDPYRLYNLDVFEYELWNGMALYAAVPFMMSHNKDRSVGIFWLNAAETWIDVRKSSSGVLGSISSFVSSSKNRVDTHWMSEAGVIDVFVFLGPRPKDVTRQYNKITGSTPLPPQFSLAYHQCRWNYNDQEDVRAVTQKFDEHDIPMDVMWLDIEHTDAKKYFTWDDRKFADPLDMIHNLTALGRKLVTIVDPHIKKDSNYWVHNDCTEKGLYVKTKEGNDYEGWCWPGASYYPDFLNKAARDYFAEQYRLENYKGSTVDLFTWNDMNEPSVFNGPEVTMPKDLIHQGGVEHRELHNMYGHLYIMGTHAGHLLRSENGLRPFILTRSAFSGSQRYAAIWTGDNTAEWGHLEASVPMCLSLSISGLTFVGADVGGFFGNPDGELFVRWYQAASFLPFFRSHAHIDTKRREPWLYNESEMKLIRDAIRLRYSYLPFWYTLFFEAESNGNPPMRPVWFEFPEDEGSFAVDNEFMVGDAILVHPVSKSGATDVQVYFPGGPNQPWYDIYTQTKVQQSGGLVTVPVKYDNIPVYQRGGTIVPKKERIRRSSPLMQNDPFTLVVALDQSGSASGTVYIDDGKSFDYRTGSFIYASVRFHGSKMEYKMEQKPGYETKSFLERVVIMGVDKDLGVATLKTASGERVTLATKYDAQAKLLVLRKPGVNMGNEWEITFGSPN